MKNITREDIVKGVEATAKITSLNAFFLVGMCTTVFTLPRKNTHKSDDVDLFTPEDELKNLEPVILALGEGSDFQEREGFYIERVGSWTMLTQPEGWQTRAKTIPHPTLKIQALSLIDLLFNKLEVNRPKDRKAVEEIFAKSLLTPEKLRRFMIDCNVEPEKQKALLARARRGWQKVQSQAPATPA